MVIMTLKVYMEGEPDIVDGYEVQVAFIAVFFPIHEPLKSLT